MGARTGRPKSENPKNSSIKIRLDDNLNQRLTDYADRHQIRRTDIIRAGIEMILDAEK